MKNIILFIKSFKIHISLKGIASLIIGLILCLVIYIVIKRDTQNRTEETAQFIVTHNDGSKDTITIRYLHAYPPFLNNTGCVRARGISIECGVRSLKPLK